MFVHVCAHLLHTYVRTHIRAFVCTHIHTYMHTYTYVHTYVHMYVHMCLRTYVCISHAPYTHYSTSPTPPHPFAPPPQFMYPTSKSMMKQSFLPSSGLTGREPLPSVSHKANHSNGFTKGNQATADFAPTASRPVGYTTSQQIHPLSMNTVKRESPAEAMNIVNPHNRSTVAQLSYRPPGYTRRVGESRAQQLGAVATATKEMSGYCENEHPNLDHMSREENPRKFVTQYTERLVHCTHTAILGSSYAHTYVLCVLI